jgi:hypothetical protein
MSWQISSELANATVLDPSGNKFRLGDSWITRPAVLVFIRHFG